MLFCFILNAVGLRNNQHIIITNGQAEVCSTHLSGSMKFCVFPHQLLQGKRMGCWQGNPLPLPVSWILQHWCPKEQINLAGTEGRPRLVWRATTIANCFLPGARVKPGNTLLSYHCNAYPGLLTASACLPLIPGRTAQRWCSS